MMGIETAPVVRMRRDDGLAALRPMPRVIAMRPRVIAMRPRAISMPPRAVEKRGAVLDADVARYPLPWHANVRMPGRPRWIRPISTTSAPGFTTSPGPLTPSRTRITSPREME